MICELNDHHYHYQSRMVTDGRFRYVFNAPDIDELCDLDRNPWETTNLLVSSAHGERLASMRECLLYHAEIFQDPLLTWMRNLFVTRQRDYTEYGADCRAR